MKTTLVVLCLLSTMLSLYWASDPSDQGLNLGLCRVSTNLDEAWNAFMAIRKYIQSLDSSSSLRIIDRSCLQDIAPSEQCCILRLLLNFYLGKVFRHCESVDPLLRRNIGVIANSFLSIKRELRICQAETRCVCRRQSRLTCQTIQENFEKMDISTAVLKALGELDILLDWMERIR